MTSPANLRVAAALAIGVFVSVAVLGVFAYRAVDEWQRTAALLAERHAQEGADQLALALTRDMRGAQASVFSAEEWSDVFGSLSGGPYGLNTLVASTFARFPYPEVFFSWPGQDAHPSVEFFARSDRQPPWLTSRSPGEAFPVVPGTAPDTGRQLLERVAFDHRERRRFSIFSLRVGDTSYQVVARLQYRDAYREEPSIVVGFMVDLDWVRQNYFPQVARQVARIASPDSDLAFSMYPEHEAPAIARAKAEDVVVGRRVIPVVFFDPLLIVAEPPADLKIENWTLQATLADDETLRSARGGARRTLTMGALGGMVMAAGLALTLYATRSQAQLAQLRADFVATVTHELKTPIATIRAAADTLVSRRLTDVDASRRYAQLVVDESKHMTRLLDNLLAYARISDTADAYSFKPVAVDALVEQSVRAARSRLDSAGFDLQVDIPPGLPPVRADWTAMCLALDNLVDNAIRYSRDNRSLRISASQNDGLVRISVNDRGMGIPSDELSQVTRRFFRGNATGIGGSGLGLAIVERIMNDHGGSLSIRSTSGVGTTVELAVPVSQGAAA